MKLANKYLFKRLITQTTARLDSYHRDVGQRLKHHLLDPLKAYNLERIIKAFMRY